LCPFLGKIDECWGSSPGVPPGCQTSTDGIAEVVEAASQADVVVLALGGTCHEEEGADRDFLHLPGSQLDLFRAVYKSGKPIAVVLINGGPYGIDELKGSSDIAILQAGFPGQAGAQAISDILTGVVNPSGKLTTTIYPSVRMRNGKPTSGPPWMNSMFARKKEAKVARTCFTLEIRYFRLDTGFRTREFDLQWDVPPTSGMAS
jgi:hypothetical protein